MASKHNSTGRSKRSKRFVMLEHFLLNSRAWRDLTLAARSAFIEIARQYSPGNNGRLAISGRMLAAELPMSRQSATRVLQELTGHGFIEPMKQGGFNVKSGTARASEWRLTLHKCDVTGEAASHAYMKWQDGKIHFAASPQGQIGPTTGPLSKPAQQNCRKVALS